MKTTISQAPVCNIKMLDNIFIEMTAKSCNQHCRHCYIDFPISRNIKDFIPVDTVKKAMKDIEKFPVKCIYLTGAEPMTHPDFNSILRICLKNASTCICTNGSFLNEKKTRFLKRVQDEGCNEIIFKLSLDHYDELKNDELRGRGSFRQVICAVKNLVKYGFNPIIEVTNYYKENPIAMKNIFKSMLYENGFAAEDRNICINEWFDKNDKNYDMVNCDWERLDCEYGRTLSVKGVYTCPFLANDHRGRCGSDFIDFSDKNTLETPYCNICLKNKRQMFGIDFSSFAN